MITEGHMDRLLIGALGTLALFAGAYLFGHHASLWVAVPLTGAGLVVIGYAIMSAEEGSGCGCE